MEGSLPAGRLLRIRASAAERRGQLLLMLPAIVLIGMVFLLPMGLMLRMSLNETAVRPYAPGFTLDNYARALADPLFVRILFRTVRLAAFVTLICLAVGVPFTYLIWRSRGIRRTLLLSIALLPLFTNIIARIYGWQIILSRGGPLNSTLLALGIIDEPWTITFTFTGAAIGLTYVALPYFILIFLSALAGIDWDLVEAARTLGSKRLRSVFEVVIPLAGPGLATATAVAFAWGMGAYAETVTLGSPREWGLGYEAWRQWMLVRSWPMSTTLSVVMITVTLVVIILINQRSKAARRTA